MDRSESGEYHVYILRCLDGSLYTGITTDLVRRLQEHKAGTASRYTRAHGADTMMYTERAAGKGVALRREAAIKRLSRPEKLALIKTG